MSLPYGRAQLQLSTSVKGPFISSIKAQPDGVDSRFQCLVCSSRPDFAQSTSFKRHLRQHHCKVEGGSFVCLYGTNGVCASLPLEGVNATDYVQHVLRQHLQTRVPSFTGTASMTEQGSFAGAGHQSEEKWSIYSAVQNLPSALNDPKKGMTRDFFTRTWGETFTEVRSIPPHVALPQSPLTTHTPTSITNHKHPALTAPTPATNRTHTHHSAPTATTSSTHRRYKPQASVTNRTHPPLTATARPAAHCSAAGPCAGSDGSWTRKKRHSSVIYGHSSCPPPSPGAAAAATQVLLMYYLPSTVSSVHCSSILEKGNLCFILEYVAARYVTFSVQLNVS
ncbi:hypothetical protein FHG87_018001 [Trinorchestia longiramus]|nr:hypothetical protein FHG87_018001 [Trinorchestia longiramus]